MKQIIDWYWSEGCLRSGEHALSRGTWLDSLYAIAARRDALAAAELAGGAKRALGASGPSQSGKSTMMSRYLDAGAKRALGVWGPSQSGKSTMMSRYLDAGQTEQGSPCLTWDPSEPTIFLHRPDCSADTVVLNPDNKGKDASACVTRYTLVQEVKHSKHPVQLRFNSVAHVMHALARGYLSECRLDVVEGKVISWELASVREVFLSAPLPKGAVVDKAAFELLRETLCIVDLFIETKEGRYRNLSKGWNELRQEFLNESPALRSVDEVIRLAKRLLWDDAASVSVTFDKLLEKLQRLNWPDGRVYCSMQVAGLILDFATFNAFKKSDPNEAERRVTEAVGLLGYRRLGEDILVECCNEAPDIARGNFGLFQALVRELVVPVRKPSVSAEADSAFFRLLAIADLLDFPGVALADASNSEASLINPATLPASDMRWLTTVFKRGKTASMVHGYAQDVSIDAFALLIRSGAYPAKPKQLTSGITHWWAGVNDKFDPNDPAPGAKPPLPLSICLTFFAKVVNRQLSGSSKSMDAPFEDMLDRLVPLTRGSNSQLFATTYKHFDKEDGPLRGSPEEIAKVTDFIMKDVAFRAAFRNDVAVDSFKAMIDREDGGVEFFLQQQIIAVEGSARRAKLAAIVDADQLQLRIRLEEALPSGDDDGAAQGRVIQKFLAQVEGRHTDPAGQKFQFEDYETTDSLYGYWIRQLTCLEEADVEPVPTNFTQHKMQVRQKYVTAQWASWRQSAQVRMKGQPGFTWSRFGMDSQEEIDRLLSCLSAQDASDRLFQWVSEEMGDVQHESVARSMRRELAVAMGNILRHGMQYLAAAEARDPLALLREQSRRRARDTSVRSPHELFILDGFLGRLKSFKPALAKRPPQPGDDTLRELIAKI